MPLRVSSCVLLVLRLAMIVLRAFVGLGKHLRGVSAICTGAVVQLVVGAITEHDQVLLLVLVALLAGPLALDDARLVMDREPAVLSFAAIAVYLAPESVTSAHAKHQARAQPAT